MTNLGDKPRPIRKKGYFRALKRGEPWALYKKTFKDLINTFAADMYDRIFQPSPFLKMTGLKEIVSEHKSIPIIYGDHDE